VLIKLYRASWVLTHPDFYKAPIILENEPDQEFLEFLLELNPFEMIYQSPGPKSSPLPYVSIPTYGPPQWICAKMLHRPNPQLQVTRGLQQLRDLYLRAGFAASD